MIAPEVVVTYLMERARTILYSSLPEHSWFTQQGRVKAALTLPAKWLDDRKVELPAERYQAIVDGILDTIRANGRRDLGAFPCAYLHHCVETHLQHHGEDYYAEGKGIRNRVKMFMNDVEKAHVGADSTIPVLAQAHRVEAALAVGKRKSKVKAPTQQTDLFK